MRLILGLPLPVAFRRESDLLRLQDECLAELVAHSGQLQVMDSDLGNLELSVYDSPDADTLIGRHWKHPGTLREYRLLRIAVDGHQCIQRLTAEHKISQHEDVRRQAEQLAVEFAIVELEMQVSNLLLLANVLRPGSISADKGYALNDEQFISETTPFFAEHLYKAVEAASVGNWPSFQIVKLRNAWSWLTKSGCVFDGIGTGRLGRAWAALSHVTTNSLAESSSIDLVWVLLGLEALYGKGNLGLKEQLVAKTEVLFGQRSKNKKSFGAVYDYHSRFLHGDVDLPLRYTPYNAVSKYEKYHEELYRHESLALAVLIATLQLMASRSWAELDFKYSVSARTLTQ